MMKSIKNKLTGSIKNILIGISLLLYIGCEDLYYENSWYDYPELKVKLNIDLPQDDNGYYHMSLGDGWQTLQRLTANVEAVGKDYEWWERNDAELQKFHWESSHYWYVGDTLGYIYKRGLTSDLVYVNYDTTYVTWVDGFEVPVVNGNSYSNSDLEINTMFAPVKVMSGDTIKVNLYWYDWNLDYNNEDFEIIVN